MAADWAAAYAAFRNSGVALGYPSETVIRLLKGNYVSGAALVCAGKRILDVGFGAANNALFCAASGMHVSGVEIHQDICDQATAMFGKLGLVSDFRVGTNRALPYADDTFDYLLSWNVIHYEGDEANVKAAIREYARVLKKGAGRLILSTTGPTHKILRDGRTLGGHRYELGRADDFRKGQVHFFFDAPNYIEYYFGAAFADVQIGRIEDTLFREKLDWFLVTGVAK